MGFLIYSLPCKWLTTTCPNIIWLSSAKSFVNISGSLSGPNGSGKTKLVSAWESIQPHVRKEDGSIIKTKDHQQTITLIKDQLSKPRHPITQDPVALDDLQSFVTLSDNHFENTLSSNKNNKMSFGESGLSALLLVWPGDISLLKFCNLSHLTKTLFTVSKIIDGCEEKRSEAHGLIMKHSFKYFSGLYKLFVEPIDIKKFMKRSSKFRTALFEHIEKEHPELAKHLNERLLTIYSQNLAAFVEFSKNALWSKEQINECIQDLMTYYQDIVLPAVLTAVMNAKKSAGDGKGEKSKCTKSVEAIVVIVTNMIKKCSPKELFGIVSFGKKGIAFSSAIFKRSPELNNESAKILFPSGEKGAAYFLSPNSEGLYFKRLTKSPAEEYGQYTHNASVIVKQCDVQKAILASVVSVINTIDDQKIKCSEISNFGDILRCYFDKKNEDTSNEEEENHEVEDGMDHAGDNQRIQDQEVDNQHVQDPVVEDGMDHEGDNQRVQDQAGDNQRIQDQEVDNQHVQDLEVEDGMDQEGDNQRVQDQAVDNQHVQDPEVNDGNDHEGDDQRVQDPPETKTKKRGCPEKNAPRKSQRAKKPSRKYQ
jgi:hypothetical protein